MPRRVEASTDRLLEMFDRAGVTASFFTLGWVAERHPMLIRRIVAAGHELASHGYGHERVDLLGRSAFRADIRRARQVLEEVSGVAVVGYRAPTFSITASTPWVYTELQSEGYRYSSSVYPVRHDLYGIPDAPRFPYRPGGGTVWEIPLTTIRAFGCNLPCAGGGYFRIIPYRAFRLALRRFHGDHGAPGVFYTHPWEFRSRPATSGCRKPSFALPTLREPFVHDRTTATSATGFRLGQNGSCFCGRSGISRAHEGKPLGRIAFHSCGGIS